jgi:septal ring factor EnvC (AmiA/AmiB activator)
MLITQDGEGRVHITTESIYKCDWGDWFRQASESFNSITNNDIELVDKSKFDVVEKKEAKIERLKAEIENLKSHEDTCSRIITKFGDELRETQDQIEYKEKELKKLSKDVK